MFQDLRFGVRMLLNSPGIHARGDSLFSDWDRRERGALQRRQCGPMASVAVPGLAERLGCDRGGSEARGGVCGAQADGARL